MVGTIMLAGPLTAWPQNVRDREGIARILTVEKVTVAEGVVSGEVLNRSANTVRDAQLFIRYTWLWNNEMKPSKEDPGTSTYHTLPSEIAPGARLPFSSKPSPPLSRVSGGHFEVSVTIAGFTKIIPRSR